VLKKPWGGRFKKDTHKIAEKFSASVDFDKRLYKEDIEGSIAHVTMLAENGIILKNEAEKITKGLKQIEKEIDSGKFPFRAEYEDIHLNIEKRLIEKIGDTGGKIHTARSRNDQIALDMRLYLRKEINEIILLLKDIAGVLIELAEKKSIPVMPSTPTSRGQPVLLSHHLMGLYEMLKRDRRDTSTARQGKRDASRCGSRGGDDVSDRQGIRREAPRFPESHAKQHRHGERQGFHSRVHSRFCKPDDAPEQGIGRIRALVDEGIRFRRPRGRVHHRIEHHAAEKEPRHGRAHSRKTGRVYGNLVPSDDNEGLSPTTGTCRGQGADVDTGTRSTLSMFEAGEKYRVQARNMKKPSGVYNGDRHRGLSYA
jgi:hypothetical protein